MLTYNLRLAVATLAQLNHIADFKDLPQTVDKIRKAIGRWVDQEAQHKAIYFDPLPQYEGSRLLPFFMDAIEKEHQVQFDYFSFQASASKNYIFDPYFLRQHHQRWYVGGWSHDINERFIRTFPLERIEGEPILTGKFIDFSVKPQGFNPITYWQHVIGIMRPANGLTEKVILQFSSVQGKYFESQPFYQPYEVLEKTEDKLVVQMYLMIEIELIRKIAAYGYEVRVLEPRQLAETMYNFFEKAIMLYTGMR
jgi:predicted DNA-binding transcriptional regulator YafY